ncbi:P-loop ATPase, Sll1717 family [Rathayibacter sp. PhB127]|uniref:P-loop ATPase, Sll1717 family n=1 Tax=Rathayibacter sp. PhB127 TaxID=2485176 RepID=UPI0011CD499E|nr:hypothetical protein [Rathayibacter sp. PhB127]
MASRSRIKPGFTLGGEQAEADPLAIDAFVNSNLYEVVEDRADRRCFLVGRTGSGKSAALQHLEETEPDHVIRISPEDLSLPYITDMQLIRFMDSLDVKLDLFWIALWKHLLLVEIIRHRYGVNSLESKQRFLGALRDKLQRQPGKQAALEYLDEFQGRFWVDADERVREITDRFTEKVGAEFKGSGSVGAASASGAISASQEQSSEQRTELASRYQRIVNETQLAKINQMLTVLNDEILDEVNFTYIIIDDLDRDWVDERLSNSLIRCLFRTVLDLQRVKNLKIVVALRTNIFQELDFGSSGGQEEKFRALVLEMRWTKPVLENILDERVRVSQAKSSLDATTFRELLPHANNTRGNPLEYIMDRTLLRPRDAIAFANQCLLSGAGKTKLTWDDIKTAEVTYSANRLLALRDEWKPTYPGIDDLLTKFRGAPARMSKKEFQERLEECALLMSSVNFRGTAWLTPLAEPIWEAGHSNLSWFDRYSGLTGLFYNIGVIGCASAGTAAPTFFDADPNLASSPSRLEKSEYFHVHRMLHRALDISVSQDHRARHSVVSERGAAEESEYFAGGRDEAQEDRPRWR